ncbi:hypothetical protein [Gordonia iterans]
MTAHSAGTRIVVVGYAARVQRLIDAPGVDRLARLRPTVPPPPAFESLRALLRSSMETFEHRITGEAEHASWIAGESIVHDYVHLRRSLERSEITPRRDAAFARRYVAALEALCVRHARARYSLVVNAGGHRDDALDRLLAATGVPYLRLPDSRFDDATGKLSVRPGALHV